MRFVNIEKVLFAGSLLCALSAGVYAWHDVPDQLGTGAHHVTLSAPPAVHVVVPDVADVDLSGDRANPFAFWRAPIDSGNGDKDTEVNKDPVDKAEHKIPVLPDIDGLNELKDAARKRDEQKSGPIAVAAPYEVPAEFRGVYRHSGSELKVILEDKSSRSQRSLYVGDRWPDLNLHIIRITSDSVLLENDAGKRFLMRDLYGRRTTGKGNASP